MDKGLQSILKTIPFANLLTHRVEREGAQEEVASNITFEFPIRDIQGKAPIKNIPLSTLPNFHGLASEYPNTFSFSFDVFFRLMTMFQMPRS